MAKSPPPDPEGLRGAETLRPGEQASAHGQAQKASLGVRELLGSWPRTRQELELPAAGLGVRDRPARTGVWSGSLPGLGFRTEPIVGKRKK